jgi:hypothetical protein
MVDARTSDLVANVGLMAEVILLLSVGPLMAIREVISNAIVQKGCMIVSRVRYGGDYMEGARALPCQQSRSRLKIWRGKAERSKRRLALSPSSSSNIYTKNPNLTRSLCELPGLPRSHCFRKRLKFPDSQRKQEPARQNV